MDYCTKILRIAGSYRLAHSQIEKITRGGWKRKRKCFRPTTDFLYFSPASDVGRCLTTGHVSSFHCPNLMLMCDFFTHVDVCTDTQWSINAYYLFFFFFNTYLTLIVLFITLFRFFASITCIVVLLSINCALEENWLLVTFSVHLVNSIDTSLSWKRLQFSTHSHRSRDR